jgi:hypothetical protein
VSKIITVTIDEVGQSVDLAGYHGKGCEAVQKAFEQAVGPSTKVVTKAEYFFKKIKNLLVR